MATYRFHALLINLHITDTPVGYAPPRGPAVYFEVTYNHKEATQPQIFTYSNLGPRWTFDQLSFIEDDDLAAIVLHVRGGGAETLRERQRTGLRPDYLSQNRWCATSRIRSPGRCAQRDGSVDIYAQPDCSSAADGVCS